MDMAELLKDKTEAERRRLAVVEGNTGIPNPRQEVPNLLGWLFCYSLLAAIVCKIYPEKAKEIWLIRPPSLLSLGGVVEMGGIYMTLHSGNRCPPWRPLTFSKLSQALYTTTFLAYWGKGQFCLICMMSDHNSEECALNSHQRDRHYKNNKRDSHGQRSLKPRRGRRGACFSWTDRKCTRYPYCNFEHRCSGCGGEHKRIACNASGQSKEKKVN